jgi:hypothetical protein
VLPDPDGDVLEDVFRVVPVTAEPQQHSHRNRPVPVDQHQKGLAVGGHIALVSHPRRDPRGVIPTRPLLLGK